jgi:hypothetical protein
MSNREIMNEMAGNIKALVDEEMEAILVNINLYMSILVGRCVKQYRLLPQVCMVVSAPVIVYISYKATKTMRQSSRNFDKQVTTCCHILSRCRRRTSTSRSGRLTGCCSSSSRASSSPS